MRTALHLEIQKQRRMVGEAGQPLVVRIADCPGASGQSRRQECVVDAKAVAARAVPGKLATIGISPAPQVAKPDRLDLVEKMRRRIDCARLVDIGAAGVE